MSTIDSFASLVEDRRALHRIPEIGFDLFKTRDYVLNALAPLAPSEVREVAGGIVCVFRAPGERPAIAFRADMDALELRERTGLPFASEHEGCMHACGHDGHTAALIALARIVAARRAELTRSVVLVFQPGEESQGGARRMLNAGALSGLCVGEMYGMHVMPRLPEGKIGTRPGPMMAMVECVDFIIRGRAGHGAEPHTASDAVLAMAHFISNVQTALKRRISAFEPTILSIGKVRAGDVRNIVADWAEMECTTRAFSDETAQQISQVIADCLRAGDQMFGTTSQALPSTRYPAVINPQAETERLIALAGERYVAVEPMTIAEDFSEYQREFPAVFFFTGVGGEGTSSPLHSDCFNFNERALLPGIELFARLAFEN